MRWPPSDRKDATANAVGATRTIFPLFIANQQPSFAPPDPGATERDNPVWTTVDSAVAASREREGPPNVAAARWSIVAFEAPTRHSTEAPGWPWRKSGLTLVGGTNLSQCHAWVANTGTIALWKYAHAGFD
jgi:hypothetical protein